MKVTVVVPVYNPGSAMDLCIASLLAQTMQPDEWEAVFVDDGSTDATPARLDALAAEHPNISVIHTPNSGWAGRPRNIGIDVARGEYVQFLDQDDALTPEALARQVAMADRNGSDIVVGKEASDFRLVPLGLFRTNVESCTIENTALIHSLTPHKMFRTAFLREHDLRFPEGRRRLEDQLFVVQAYFRAKVISILADHVCYRYLRRADSQNAGGAAADWDGYYANAREVTDVVFANTAPGEFRDTLLLRFVRVEILRRVSDLYFAAQSAASRAQLFPAARDLARDIATPGVVARLDPLQALRLRLLLADDAASLLTLSERMRRIVAEAVLRESSWDGPCLALRIRCGLRDADGSPLTIVPVADRWLLHPALFDGIDAAPLDITGILASTRVVVSLRQPGLGGDWALKTSARIRLPPPTGATPTGDPAPGPVPVEVEVVASLDVHRVASGGPITDGHWPLQARLHVAGFDRTTSVRVSPAHDAAGAAGVRVVGQEPLVVALARDVPDVVVQAARGPAALAARLAGEGFRFGPTDGRSLEVVLMGSGTRGTADIPAVLVISDSEAPYRLTVRLRPGRTGLRLRTRVRLPVGSDRAATIKVEFGARAEASVDLGAARVTADGLVFPEEAPRVGRMGLVLHHALEAVMDTASTLRSRGGRIALRARRRGGRLVRRARRP